jgi:hypothetical protein
MNALPLPSGLEGERAVDLERRLDRHLADVHVVEVVAVNLDLKVALHDAALGVHRLLHRRDRQASRGVVRRRAAGWHRGKRDDDCAGHRCGQERGQEPTWTHRVRPISISGPGPMSPRSDRR